MTLSMSLKPLLFSIQDIEPLSLIVFDIFGFKATNGVLSM